jgi:CRP-like cAMP-binding protein
MRAGCADALISRAMSRGVVMENRLLASLAAPDFALLQPHFKQVSLLQGAVLQVLETPVEWVYFPLSGSVSLLALMKGGEAVEIASVGREGAISLSAHSGPWQARARAIVQVPGVAMAISLPLLRIAILQSEHLRDLVVRYMETLWVHSQQIAACNALHSVQQRLARWLLQLSDRVSSAELPATQEMIAKMIGAQRTTVTLAARHFQREGLIQYRRARIKITNPTALHALACECYEACKQADQLVQNPAGLAAPEHVLLRNRLAAR